jgi:hypothetical protein
MPDAKRNQPRLGANFLLVFKSKTMRVRMRRVIAGVSPLVMPRYASWAADPELVIVGIFLRCPAIADRKTKTHPISD